MRVEIATVADGEVLADLRVRAMKDSLQAIGRFDPVRARERFLSDYSPGQTMIFYDSDAMLGFCTVVDKSDHYYLSHLYVEPSSQGNGIGSQILKQVMEKSDRKKKPIRLGALKESRSNEFYKSHEFVKTHEGEFDNYYERKPVDQEV